MGMMNMFATLCSNPIATNAEIGNQTPTALPGRSFAADANQIAKQTNQLHKTPLVNAYVKVREVFATAIALGAPAVANNPVAATI